ncbi:MAG: hypothetical protein KUG82_03070 [Pseudomonadales bacterium]|nr:hypothetical protein [Pseudomonadales bacterium]
MVRSIINKGKKFFLRVAILLLQILFCTLASTTSVLASSDPLNRSLPSLDVIPGATSQWIAETMAINGLPMSIKEFKFLGSEDSVKQFYRSRWKTKGHGKTTEQRLGFDTILGYELNGYYYSVQFHKDGKVVIGRLTVSEIPNSENTRKQKTDFPMPPNSRLMKKMEYLDQGRRSETLTIASRRSVNSATYYVENQLQSDGWALSIAPIENSSVRVHYRQIQYQRRAEHIQITFFPQASNKRETEILVNWMNKQ